MFHPSFPRRSPQRFSKRIPGFELMEQVAWETAVAKGKCYDRYRPMDEGGNFFLGSSVTNRGRRRYRDINHLLECDKDRLNMNQNPNEVHEKPDLVPDQKPDYMEDADGKEPDYLNYTEEVGKQAMVLAKKGKKMNPNEVHEKPNLVQDAVEKDKDYMTGDGNTIRKLTKKGKKRKIIKKQKRKKSVQPDEQPSKKSKELL